MRRFLSFAVPVLILAGMIVWRLHANAANNAILKAAAGGGGRGGAHGPAVVSVSPVISRNMIHTFSTTANIESPQTVKISPQIQAEIVSIPVQEGDPVHKGEVLIQLDQSQLLASVAKENALLAEAKAKLLQAQVVKNSTLVPLATQIVQNQAAVAAAQANYYDLRDTLKEQIAAADAAVADARSKVANAQASLANTQAGVGSAQANETNANTSLARQQSLFDQGAIAQQDVDNARTTAQVETANVGVAQAQVNAAQASLESAKVELSSAEATDVVTKQKDVSDIEAAKSAYVQSIQLLKNSHANTEQSAAYYANLAALAADEKSVAADLQTAEVQLRQTVVTSPIDGFVSSRLADPGTLSTPGTVVLQVQELGTVWVNLPVPQEEIGQIQSGQKAAVTVDNYPGRRFIGHVFEIDPSGDPASRDFTVRLSLKNPGALLKPGMYAHATLVTQRLVGATVVPLEAIQTDPLSSAASVWVMNPDSTVHQQPVTVGPSDDNGTVILSGVKPGDKVVTVNAAHLKDGANVVIGGVGPSAGKAGHHHHHSQAS